MALDFRVVHPSIDPGVAAKKLGLKLNRSWKVGEVKTTPKGLVLGGKRKESYGSFTLEDSSASGPADLIARWNGRLERHSRFFRRLCRTGGTAEYYVTWYTGNRASAGDVFDRSLLLATARIGLGISLEVLPWWGPRA